MKLLTTYKVDNLDPFERIYIRGYVLAPEDDDELSVIEEWSERGEPKDGLSLGVQKYIPELLDKGICCSQLTWTGATIVFELTYEE